MFWDHGTGSFWLQTSGECLVGPLTGRKLAWIPTEMTTWGEWKKSHPETTVLGPVLPMEAYEDVRKGYARYQRRGRPVFATGPNKMPDTYRPMDTITITRVDGKARAYPHRALKAGVNRDGGFTITRTGRTVVVRDGKGALVPSMSAYWFAFAAFYSDGTVWSPPKESAKDPR